MNQVLLMSLFAYDFLRRSVKHQASLIYFSNTLIRPCLRQEGLGPRDQRVCLLLFPKRLAAEFAISIVDLQIEPALHKAVFRCLL